jgi:hypothetical protein
MEVVNRFRRGLSGPFTADVLKRAGISDSLTPRTLQALRALDLIDDKGIPSSVFEALRRASEGEYPQRLADWLNGAYADVLNYVDPATADEVAIRDAFRNYNPVAQQPRMVTLFTGLYAVAGIRTDKPSSQHTPRQPRAPIPKPRTSVAAAKLSPDWAKVSRMWSHPKPDLPPALAGVMASLPAFGKGWTQEKRDQFLKLIGTALDFCFPIISQEELDRDQIDTSGEEVSKTR